jgi:sialate O-acetylesterase
MVKSWREMFGEDFAFIFTQLSTWNNGGGTMISNFRLMQETILDVTKNSAMITAADLGDPYSTQGEIHPRNKTELGRRMSLAASTLIYENVQPHMGPRISSISVIDDETTGYRVRVSFNPESIGESSMFSGLNLQAAQVCPEWSAAINGGCAGAKIFTKTDSTDAYAEISSSSTVDFVPVVALGTAPIQLSYCQGDYPLMTVYNGVGAPLLPFIRDL